MMILSGYVVDQKDLQYINDDGCILKQRQNFIGVEHLDTKNNMDGNWLVFDTKRNVYIRRGMAEVGMKRRWGEHLSVTLRNNNDKRNNKLYTCYPNSNCDPVNIPDVDQTMGSFNQSEPLIGVGLQKHQLTELVNLFEWLESKIKGLANILGSGSRTIFVQKMPPLVLLI